MGGLRGSARAVLDAVTRPGPPDRPFRWWGPAGLFDAGVAVLLLVWDVAGRSGTEPAVPPELWWPVSVLLAVPVAARRVLPRTAGLVVLAGVLLAVLTHPGFAAWHTGLFATAVLAQTLRVHSGRLAVAGFVAGLVVIGLVSVAAAGPPGILLWLLFVVGGWTMGEVVVLHRMEQRQVRDQAVVDERVRIAREMHDVVTHAVSLIVVQAEGARLAVRRDPDVAEQAMAAVADSGRRTLDELRGLVGALRGEGTGPGAVGELVGLVATLRAGGLDVRLDGASAALPDGLHATGYRIAQEALTNCLRHAPPGVVATVSVTVVDGFVQLTVVDDGGPNRVVPPAPVAGSGLAGMAERARAVGGSLDAGPVRSGGWRVSAALPVPAAVVGR